MVFHTARNFALMLAATALVLVSAGASADDTEIFVGNPSNLAAPNIMLILDTSGSMSANTISPIPYNPATTYTGTGNCAGIENRVYWSTGSSVPDCDSSNWFYISWLKCQAALSTTALGTGGAGAYLDRFIRWRNNSSGGQRSWRTLSTNGSPKEVECKADNGNDGNLSSTDPYPAKGSWADANGRWTATASDSVWTNPDAGTAATLYSGNYIAYWEQFRFPSVRSRMDVMKDASTRLLSALSGVNVGLMRYSRNGDGGDGDLAARGGMVAHPISPIETSRQQLIDAVNSWDPAGFTPLSETLFEAYRYFTGGAVGFGNGSQPFLSVPESRDPPQADGADYESPADFSCQKNYIVYLTDGLPTSDGESNADIQALDQFATLGGACDAAGTGPEPGWTNSGLCLRPLAGYMYNADVRGDIESKQNVTSYWIGFGSDVAGGAALDYLNRTAQAGSGGEHNAFVADNAENLTSVLTGLALQILQKSTTFTAPTVSVNAFNRTRSLSDLYVSVFQPSGERHWPGNLKKYSVKATVSGAVVVGQDGNDPPRPSNLPAIDESTGFFVDGAQSFWSASADGPRVRDGGAANKLPAPGVRNVYTYIGANPANPALLTLDASAVVDTNTAITDAMLGLAAPTPSDPSRADLIAWVRGQDVRDQYPVGPPMGNDDRAEQRRAMGDPIHAQPAVVIYGGSVATPNLDDAAAYLPTNDGYLHAVDTVSGRELWSFIPQEFIPLQYDLFTNNVGSSKSYALDGEVRVLKFDVNGDGIVTSSAGDRVILYFGMGRGGDGYYALDVTDKQAPRFMWRLGPTELPGVGLTWSTPTIARVNVNGQTQNSQKLVLVMGGGYDTAQDGTGYAVDGVGNRIFIVDALTGSLLWSAGPSGADLNNTRMTHGIPASITVLDTNSDGFSDRMYAGDMSAQVWRFDITNGNARGSLVAGGVIASLGSHDEGTHLAINNRRFYNAPDVAAIQRPTGGPFLNIALGSGYRGHPLDQTIRDRFYSIRDTSGFTALTQAQYDALTIMTQSSLVDITTDLAPNMPADALGWRLDLNQPGGTWRGEKVLGEATTINNNVVFTTYTPSTGIPADPCAPTLGTNRAYAVKVLDGSPTRVDGTADVTDRYDDFEFGGIAGDISTMVLGSDAVPCIGENCPPPCVGPNCPPPPGTTQFVCLAGVRVLDICRDFDSRVKTYWRETSAN